MNESFSLSNEERASPLWRRLIAHMQECLERARVRNDKPMSEIETAKIRGEIHAIKLILELDKPPVQIDQFQPPR